MVDGFSDAGLTGGIVAFADTLDHAALPASVVHEATRAWVNAVGCMIGGSHHPLVDTAVDTLMEFSGPATVPLLGRGARADGLTAVLLNALAGAAYSFDDTYSDAMLHPAGPIASALIVIARRTPVDGRRFLSAFAAGIEVACRLTRAVALPPAEGEMAWSQTGIVCGMAAALAAGKLLGLDHDAQVGALGIAASQAAGSRTTHGSMAASLIFGHAAQTGLRAALLAANGFSGPPNAIEGRFGFLELFARAACAESAIEGLGTNFELLRLTYKPFPCGMVIHPALDGVLRLRESNGLTAGEIERVAVQVSAQAIRFGWHPEPRDSLEAKVSLHHWLAVALLTGRAGLAEGTIEMVRDPAVVAVRGRIDITEDAALRNDAARVAITTNDGTVHAIRIDHCVGSAEQPMSDDQISRKFIEQTEPALGEARADELLARCWAVADNPDIGALIEHAG